MAMTVAQPRQEFNDHEVEMNMPKTKATIVDTLMAADAVENFGNGALLTADRRRQGNR
jgi:hypothetical protein